ncbi:MAG: pentapeptide repeat-containing protein [Prochloraceae cyanobacterium]
MTNANLTRAVLINTNLSWLY